MKTPIYHEQRRGDSRSSEFENTNIGGSFQFLKIIFIKSPVHIKKKSRIGKEEECLSLCQPHLMHLHGSDFRKPVS
jgi:hypothetical protein